MMANRGLTSIERILKAIAGFDGMKRVARRVDRRDVEYRSRQENVGINLVARGFQCSIILRW